MNVRRIIPLALLLIGVAILYARVSTAYYCSYDDFDEVHRAAFEDRADPGRIFTTSHWGTYKYRPLNRGVNYVTYIVGEGAASMFRLRNLAFHLVNVLLIFTMARLLDLPYGAAVFAALLFGVHPMTNQSIIGAVMTNTMAYSAFLGTAAAYLSAIRRTGRAQRICVLVSALCAAIALYTYDPTIAVIGLVGLHAALFWMRHGRLPLDGRTFTLAVIAAAGIAISYVLVRWWIVPAGFTAVSAEVPTPLTVIRNLAVYSFALVSPMDFVLGHAWFGTPLPPDLIQQPRVLVLAVSLLSALILSLLVWLVPCAWRSRERFRGFDIGLIAFLAGGILITLVPVLTFSAHASETYLYAPTGFYALLVAVIGTTMRRWIGPRASRAALILAATLIGLYSAAIWERNDRVHACGATAYRIVRAGAHEAADVTTLLLFEPVSSSMQQRYGFYRFHGLATVGHGANGNRALTHAVQLATRNPEVRVRILNSAGQGKQCASVRADVRCLLVYPDGRAVPYPDELRHGP